MTTWKTNKIRGLIVGVGLIVSIILVDAVLIWIAATHPLRIGTFVIGLAVLVSFGLLGILGYWLYGLSRSGYFLDRNVLAIHWGPTEQIIPTNQIERVFTGAEIEERIQFYGGAWPGHCVGYGEVPGAGQTLFYATVYPRHQIYVVTPSLTYGISPQDSEGFLKSLQRRLEMGPTQVAEQTSRRPGFLSWTIWEDRLGLALLAAGFLAVLALTGWLCYRFPALPRLVPMHFDVAGNPDRLEPRGQIFVIPLIGLLTLVFNGALGLVTYRHERMASYLLWAGVVLVQALVWAAAIGILGHLYL